jgi:hypothetical protein
VRIGHRLGALDATGVGFSGGVSSRDGPQHFDYFIGSETEELAGLRIPRLDLLRGTIDITEALTEVNGTGRTGRRRRASLARCPFPGSWSSCWPTT